MFLAAEEGAGARALGAALGAGHEVVGVLAEGASSAGGVVAAAARRAGVALLPAESTSQEELAALIRRARVELLLNVHSLRILDEEVLAAPAIGCFNLHPGPLPTYAGLNAPSWAIYRGETHYGCSVHWMTNEVDAGAVAYAAEFEVGPRETGVSLGAKCVRHGIPLVERLLAAAAEGGRSSIPAFEQDRSRRRYFRHGPPAEGWVPWAEPAARVDALVRAATFDPFPSPWGPPRTVVDGVTVAIRKTEPSSLDVDADPGTIGQAREDGVPVAAGAGWVLVRDVVVDGVAQPAADALPSGARCAPVIRDSELEPG